ncbi:hypothetical protein N9917_00010 [Deltaproteobacteria bacterium]|nr:hypothetical protein [Deltaproteobacteria bacterium]
MSLPIAEALLLTDITEVLDEILSRKELRYKMVGSLYPNIVVDEIGQLVGRYEELGGERLSDALYLRKQELQ